MDTRFLGQFLILGLPGTELDRATQRVIQDLQPGGFILFSRNVESTRQLRQFTDTLRRLCTDEPIIAIDEEGGRVSRLEALGVRTPSPGRIAAAGDPGLVAMHARVIANFLRLLGINVNLAPVLDLSLGSDELDGTLRQRCWGTETAQIISNSHIFLSEMKKAGMVGCAKHFPTYTGSAVDPHHALPSIPGDIKSLLAGPVAPFLALSGEVAAIMTAHVRLPEEAQTGGKAASLSPVVVQKFLRDQLGFNGLVITDDLDMGAIREHHGVVDAAADAMLAGSDMVLLCHHPEESFSIRERFAKLPHAVLHDALKRIEKFRSQLPKTIAFREDRWKAALDEADELEKELSSGIPSVNDDTVSSPVENY